jgi:hypothetical protein
MPEDVSYDVIGLTGLEIQSGIIREEFLTDLRGANGMAQYSKMRDNDPVIGGFLNAIETLARSASWTVEAGADGNEENAIFVDSCLNDMEQSWTSTLSEILSMLPFGWSLHEKLFKLRKGPEEDDPNFQSQYSDGKVGWRAFEIRGQESLVSWQSDETATVTAMVQQAAPDYVQRIIPLEKSLLFRTRTTKNNPEGRSILRNSYVPWYRKTKIEEIEGIGVERDLAGLPVMYVPQQIMSKNAKPDEKALFEYCKNIVENIRNDSQAGLVLPAVFDPEGNRLFEIQLLNSEGRRNFDTSVIITRYDQRIAMSVMADFILIGHDNVGSFALSSDKTHMFAVAVGAYLDIIADVINTHAIPELLRFNGIQTETPPKLVHGDVETIPLLELGSFIARLAGAGMPLFPDDNLEMFLRRQGGMPPVRGPDAVSLFEAQQIGGGEDGADGDGERPGGGAATGQTVDRQGRVRGPRNLLSGGDAARV